MARAMILPFFVLAGVGVASLAVPEVHAGQPLARTHGCLSARRQWEVEPAKPAAQTEEGDADASSHAASDGAAGGRPGAGVLARAACLWDLPWLPRKVRFPFGRITLNMRAFIQYDAAAYGQAPAGALDQDYRRGTVVGPPSTEALQAADMPNGGNLRRARIGFDGAFKDNITFRAMFEAGAFGQTGQPRITEAWVSYNRFAPFSLQAGAFAQPENLDDVTGAQDTLFLERATSAQLARNLGAGDGRLGVTLNYAGKTWTAAVSLTGPVIDHAEAFTPKGAVVARVAKAFDLSPDDSIHIGANATYVFAPSTSDPSDPNVGFPVRFRAQPEVNVAATRLIDTADISARRASVLGLEFAAQHRNLYVQAEDFRFEVERRPPTNLENPRFSGFYVEGGWVITGERRTYNRIKGSFRNPAPRKPLGEPGGWGAFELAARFSTMNLNFHPGLAGQPPPPEGVRGGDERIVSLGLNWFPTPKMELMMDYMNLRVDRLNPASPLNPQPFGPPPYTPPVGAQIGQTMNMFVVRVQYIF